MTARIRFPPIQPASYRFGNATKRPLKVAAAVPEPSAICARMPIRAFPRYRKVARNASQPPSSEGAASATSSSYTGAT